MWQLQPTFRPFEIIAIFQMRRGDHTQPEDISAERDRTPLGAGPTGYGQEGRSGSMLHTPPLQRPHGANFISIINMMPCHLTVILGA
jgi:hypothetical protein